MTPDCYRVVFMYSFKNDYSEGAHPQVLDALSRSNLQQLEGYGLDQHSLDVVARIRELVGDPDASVHLISGGTQTNLIAISSFLRPHEACIAPKTGHIAVHEAGAIEATGHKLLTVETSDGKLTTKHIAPLLKEHHFEHMVKPRLVYISNPTELGTIYSHSELETLYHYCQEHRLLLYLDGARLGSAISVDGSGLDFANIYQNSDGFFIGGTKNGALLGEILVLKNHDMAKEYRYLIKQRGALLAKGRILGIQFAELFRDNLYLQLASHANQTAQHMVKELAQKGCQFHINSPTNQIFPILPTLVIEQLSRSFDFYTWQQLTQDQAVIRLVTSWATPMEQVESFIREYQTAMS